jgi:hypothetical protein
LHPPHLKKVAFGGGQGIVKAKRIQSQTEKFNTVKKVLQ